MTMIYDEFFSFQMISLVLIFSKIYSGSTAKEVELTFLLQVDRYVIMK